MPQIIIHYSALDGFHETRHFKTVAGAQRYAQKWVGATPEISYNFQYAVSYDGYGRIMAQGATMTELFPQAYRVR